ncbi:MAG TPA: hypothetical protein VJ814_01595 [Gaiellaceae bacterium]|nr:hypothetical protein [Gaiellaceae bacterium]
MPAPFLEEIVRAVELRSAPAGMRTKVVAVDGPGGAGKSALADRLGTAFGGAQVVHTDDFASWANPSDWWPTLLRDLLEPIARGEPAHFLRTHWEGPPQPAIVVVEPREFVILEGVTASREAFRPYLTFTIWVERPRELRLARGLERDGEEMRPHWELWMAGEDRYVERERPHEKADLVLPGDRDLWR